MIHLYLMMLLRVLTPNFSCSPGKSWDIVVRHIHDDFSISLLGCRQQSLAFLSLVTQQQ